MKCLRSYSNDPYFNLAAEEYLLKTSSEDIYFQYVNAPSVVIGKHQNAMAEIDMAYLEKENIILARRISGGGAVYHDQGNVNYSFITSEQPGDFIQYKKYTQPIIDCLGKLGLEVLLGKRNELIAGQKKISGTASHVYKTRVLHHGTLLYNADLKKLSKCLYVNSERYKDKSVKSVRSEVINISEIIENEVKETEFYDFLFASMLENYNNEVEMKFSEGDILEIEKLQKTKFATWEWNYAYSPKYVVSNKMIINSLEINIRLSVSKGIIEKVEVQELHYDPDINELKKRLPGLRHSKQVLNEELLSYIAESSKRKRILEALF